MNFTEHTVESYVPGYEQRCERCRIIIERDRWSDMMWSGVQFVIPAGLVVYTRDGEGTAMVPLNVTITRCKYWDGAMANEQRVMIGEP